MKYLPTLSLLLTAGIAFSQPVRLEHLPKQNRVEVTVSGRPFTAYYFPGPDLIRKPVLYPVYSPQGSILTRGWPLDPRTGERVDHPHHIGIWFNYEDVNGNDFWNNSVQASRPGKNMGTILGTCVLQIRSGDRQGELLTTSNWVDHAGNRLITDTTRIVFGVADPQVYTIDYEISLHALEDIRFRDVKDGMFAFRVARELELPYDNEQELIGEDGKISKRKDKHNVTGSYRNRQGIRDDDAWGKPSEWCALTGRIGNDDITIAILDHPANVGYPAYFHARGYGLFSLNSLGRNAFDKSKPPLDFQLPHGRSVLFRYRVIIASRKLSDQEIDALVNR